MESLLMVFI